jgi:protocatechuate 3,4-dioxygenase, beta subunit
MTPDAPGSGQPPLLHPPYGSTRKRAPLDPPIRAPLTASEMTGPAFAQSDVGPADADLTIRGALGQKIFVTGRVTDEDGRPLARTLVEIWQANAAGRYRHEADGFRAPLDPNFAGAGRALTDDDGRYRFVTIRPGAYPWRNHHNAWRPAHIHFSLFGVSFAQRLVTQMYFEGDPLLPRDPIWTSIPDERARDRLVARHDWETTEDHHGLGYRFDIVLAGRGGTPFEP